MKNKQCICCGKIKPLDQFQKNRRVPDGFQHTCKPCMTQKQAAGYSRKKSKPQIHSGADPITALFDKEIKALQNEKRRYRMGKMRIKRENGKVILY